MKAKERVLAACAFERPDRIPTFDTFWDYPEPWRERLGAPEDLSDIAIWVPEEAPFPTRARTLKETGGWIYELDSYGRTIRRRRDAYFVETLSVPIPPGTDPESVQFDPPDLDARYLLGMTPEELQTALAWAKERHCVFAKTGGPYLRTTYVRGEAQFLMDIAGDPPLAKALADKMADYLAAVGVEEMRRWSLHDTGIFIYDDMGHNGGPMVGPRSFEQVFLPAYRRMIAAYKAAGARYVFLHSDGDIRPLLDMLIDAGIDGLNPLERRAGMDILRMRERYPHLVLIGGMDNTATLIHGPVERVVTEAREIIDLGRDGGVVIGTHSLSPEIPLEHFWAYRETCLTYGDFKAR
jgi:uroporphyrinogen-III decarboxylase